MLNRLQTKLKAYGTDVLHVLKFAEVLSLRTTEAALSGRWPLATNVEKRAAANLRGTVWQRLPQST